MLIEAVSKFLHLKLPVHELKSDFMNLLCTSWIVEFCSWSYKTDRDLVHDFPQKFMNLLYIHECFQFMNLGFMNIYWYSWILLSIHELIPDSPQKFMNSLYIHEYSQFMNFGFMNIYLVFMNSVVKSWTSSWNPLSSWINSWTSWTFFTGDVSHE